jgi:hypothetical protein
MKKLFYILLLTVATSMTFSACTEEEITPRTETVGGGGGSDPR